MERSVIEDGWWQAGELGEPPHRLRRGADGDVAASPVGVAAQGEETAEARRVEELDGVEIDADTGLEVGLECLAHRGGRGEIELAGEHDRDGLPIVRGSRP